MRFSDTFVNKKSYYSLGFDSVTNEPYMSIPVANSLVSYNKHYLLDKNQYDLFIVSQFDADIFAEQCRSQLLDNLLIIKPGTSRGSAV